MSPADEGGRSEDEGGRPQRPDQPEYTVYKSRRRLGDIVRKPDLSRLTDRLRGAGPAQLEAWDWREAAAALEVPAAKYGRLLTLQDAVRAAARNWPGATRSTV